MHSHTTTTFRLTCTLFALIALLFVALPRTQTTEARTTERRANNLLNNPGFENGANGWSPFGSAAGTVVTSEKHRGKNALQLGPGEQGLSQALNLKPNTIYTLSGWGKTTNAAEYAQITFRIIDGAGLQTEYQMAFTMTEWTRQARTITTPSAITSAMVYVLKNAGTGYFYVDTFSFAEGRDVQAWPFAKNSIWNTPIGSGAIYTPANIDAEPFVALDEGAFPYGDWNTPRRETFTRGEIAGANDFGPCNRDPAKGSVGVTQGTIQVPDSFVLNNWTRNPNFTPNNMTWIMQGDGRTVAQFQPTARCSTAGPLFGYRATDQDLYGDGIAGGHFGSGLSSMGGAIRMGELLGSGPIRHALQIDIYMARYASGVNPFRWPADRADWAHYNTPNGYCSQDPCKSNPAAHEDVGQGSLLAIPPSVTPESLGITTEIGKKIFRALQDYGGYIVDDSGYTWQLFGAEYGVKEEVKARYDIDMFTGNNASGPSLAYYNDVAAMFEALHVVDNNGAGSIGGGGTPRAPAPPDFVSPPPPPPVKLPRHGWSASSTINPADAGKILDGDPATYWRTNGEQTAGDNIVVDLKHKRVFNRVTLDVTANAPEYPQNFSVYVSNDGVNWGAPVHQGTGSGTTATLATFPVQKARYVKIELYGGHIAHIPWSLGEFDLYLVPLLIPTSPLDPTPTPAPTEIPTPTPDTCAVNQLSNPGFESGLDGWFKINDVITTTADAHTGSSALQVGPGEGGAGQTLPVAAGQTVTLTIWAKRTDASVWNGMGINFLDANYQQIGSGLATSAGSETYQQYTVTGTAPTGTAYVSVYVYKTGATGTMTLDDAVFLKCG
jgi:hypothetical protein